MTMRMGMAALCLAAGALAAPTSGMAAEQVLGKEGAFTMIVFKDGAKFNRCIMHQGQGANTLRIASPRNGEYILSIPTAGQNKTSPLSISIDGKPGQVVQMSGQDPARTWAVLPPQAVAAIKAGSKTINVDLGRAVFSWRLNSKMKDSFMVLDSCVEGYRNGA